METIQRICLLLAATSILPLLRIPLPRCTPDRFALFHVYQTHHSHSLVGQPKRRVDLPYRIYIDKFFNVLFNLQHSLPLYNSQKKILKMRSTSSILPVLALALGAAADQDWHFGDTIYMGPTSGSTYLKKLTYSLVPPAVPTDSSQSDAWLSIWVGSYCQLLKYILQFH